MILPEKAPVQSNKPSTKSNKPSTAKCKLPMYISFLLSEPKLANCQRLSEVSEASHDSVNRFLAREEYTPFDLFNEVKNLIVLGGGTLSVDDTVLDKPYITVFKADLAGWFWSGKHKKSVKGFNLITLYYTDPLGSQVPVNYRIYDKKENKTKNEYFREMLDEVIAWGLNPAWITGDSWYSSLANMTGIKNHAHNFMFAIEKNRLISVSGEEEFYQIQSFDVPEEGLKAYLKGFGEVMIFRTVFKNEYRYYIMFSLNKETEELLPLTKADFVRIHDQHWNIERYHRAIKQECNIERFQVRKERQIRTHIFCALAAFVQLEFMRSEKRMKNWYELRRNLFNEVIANFIQEGIAPDGIPFGADITSSVNA